MGGLDYSGPVFVCSCQPSLDLINKFHHLDLDEAYSDHMIEEVHHCTGSIGKNKKEYEVEHCGCPSVRTCQRCSRAKCVARLMHSINSQKVKIGLHIDFVGKSLLSWLHSISADIINVEFTVECKKKKGWYHINDPVIVSGGLINLMKEIEKKNKLKKEFMEFLKGA